MIWGHGDRKGIQGEAKCPARATLANIGPYDGGERRPGNVELSLPVQERQRRPNDPRSVTNGAAADSLPRRRNQHAAQAGPVADYVVDRLVQLGRHVIPVGQFVVEHEVGQGARLEVEDVVGG